MLKYLVLFMTLGLTSIVFCSDNEWDFFVFTQQWTPSVCEDSRSEHGNHCVIPEQVTGWTVHGLWPDKKGSETPNFCNNSLKFDWKKIESLQANLTAQWPNIFTDTNKTDFWSHEWDKHGTCAITLPATGTEYLYFSKALELNRKYNILQALKEFGVVPSRTIGYNVANVTMMLKKYFNTTPKVHCTYDKKTKRQFFIEIELCLDKEFKFTVCDNGRQTNRRQANRVHMPEDCWANETTYFYPIHPTYSAFRQPPVQIITT